MEAVCRETNLKCLVLTILVVVSSVATVVWSRRSKVKSVVSMSTAARAFHGPLQIATHEVDADETSDLTDEDPNGKVLMPTALILLLYLLYLVECWHSKAREMIARPKVDVNTVYRKVEELRRARPIVWWQAVCYHFERKTQQFARYLRADASPTSHISCDQERVVTHTATSCFLYGRNGVRDISGDLVDLEKFAVTQVQFKKAFIFHDAESAADFKYQRDSFFQDMDEVDLMMEMREGMELTKVTAPEKMTCWADAQEPPWFGRLGFFWFCSLFLLSWPLRVVLELNTAHLVYQVTKVFGTSCNCIPPPQPSLAENAETRKFSNRNPSELKSPHYRHQWFLTISNISILHSTAKFLKNILKTLKNRRASVALHRRQLNLQEPIANSAEEADPDALKVLLASSQTDQKIGGQRSPLSMEGSLLPPSYFEVVCDTHSNTNSEQSQSQNQSQSPTKSHNEFQNKGRENNPRFKLSKIKTKSGCFPPSVKFLVKHSKGLNFGKSRVSRGNYCETESGVQFPFSNFPNSSSNDGRGSNASSFESSVVLLCSQNDLESSECVDESVCSSLVPSYSEAMLLVGGEVKENHSNSNPKHPTQPETTVGLELKSQL